MINIDKLLESKRVEVKITEIKIDKYFVQQFRSRNHLTQIALANVLGVTRKTIGNWEQGINNINGSSAVLLKLLDDNPALLSQLYSVKIVEGKQEADDYRTNESTVATLSDNNEKPASIDRLSQDLKAEAIKEFVAFLKTKATTRFDWNDAVDVEDMDELAEEYLAKERDGCEKALIKGNEKDE